MAATLISGSSQSKCGPGRPFGSRNKTSTNIDANLHKISRLKMSHFKVHCEGICIHKCPKKTGACYCNSNISICSQSTSDFQIEFKKVCLYISINGHANPQIGARNVPFAVVSRCLTPLAEICHFVDQFLSIRSFALYEKRLEKGESYKLSKPRKFLLWSRGCQTKTNSAVARTSEGQRLLHKCSLRASVPEGINFSLLASTRSVLLVNLLTRHVLLSLYHRSNADFQTKKVLSRSLGD